MTLAPLWLLISALHVVAPATLQVVAPATSGVVAPATPGNLLGVVSSAQSEILLDADSLTNNDLAQALLERHNAGVDVFILLPASEAKRPTSYVNSLSLAGIAVRLHPGEADQGVMLVDRDQLFIGPALGADLDVEAFSGVAVTRAVNTFLSRFEASEFYTFTPDWRSP